jgi:hypothetical protein
MSAPSREVPIDPAHAALLIIDVQNYGVRAEVACDLGYLVTLVTDACTTASADRQRTVADRHPRLLPPAHHRCSGGRDYGFNRVLLT